MKVPDFVEGNRITLLRNGSEYFPALESAIDRAQHEVHLETYIFEYDATGIRISEALKRAARRGVTVRLLLDGFGSQNLPQEAIQNLLNTGVQVLIFRKEISPFRLRRNRLRRMHRKLAVVDASIAFVGGINVIDDLNHPEPLLPRFDFAISIEGPLQRQLMLATKHLWKVVAIARLKRWVRHNETPYLTIQPSGNQRGALVIRDNFRHRHDIEEVYLHAITNACSEIIIANAYFLPGINLRHALSDAARRGLRVVLLLQGRIEYHLQHYATLALFGSLLDAGIEIYEYHKSYLHAKVAVIDRRWSTVGSSNIDPFSLLLAREANVIVDDELFANQLRFCLENAMVEESTRVLQEKWKDQSWISRTMSWVSYYIVRVLRGMVGYNRKNNNPE
ncbi:MAG: cardiolipin synthase ClsB [Nitrosomonadaceae bacterium]|jgi:cardiolipin synthase|nr:cardiolipin synthase ClsB [Nitrosomonadaceae bacterium]